jgi:hypothetical protein
MTAEERANLAHQRETIARLLVVDANGTSFVEGHGSFSLPLGQVLHWDESATRVFSAAIVTQWPGDRVLFG